jgi:hypothetical protein
LAHSVFPETRDVGAAQSEIAPKLRQLKRAAYNPGQVARFSA